MAVSDDIALLTSANIHTGEYIAGTIDARVGLDQCIGVIDQALTATMAVLGEAQSQTLSDSVGLLNTAESKVRYAIEVLTEGMEAAHKAVELNNEYMGRLLS